LATRAIRPPPRRGPTKRQERATARHWIEFAAKQYGATRNPVFVWEAFLDARSAALPIPAWVLDYLDRVSRRIASMSRNPQSPPYRGVERRLTKTVPRQNSEIGPERRIDAIRSRRDPGDPSHFTTPSKGKIAATVYAALEFKAAGVKVGRANPFTTISDAGHEVSIAMWVYQCHSKNWQKQRHGFEGTHAWRAVFEAAAEMHNHNCDCGRTIKWKTAEMYWRKHALTVIPGHLQAAADSNKVADILR
jgi:hypothetical protein